MTIALYIVVGIVVAIPVIATIAAHYSIKYDRKRIWDEVYAERTAHIRPVEFMSSIHYSIAIDKAIEGMEEEVERRLQELYPDVIL
jgi:hypothetical protein